jgi:lactoylglutathione lyase
MPEIKVINIGVHDMREARHFYEEILGFSVADDSFAPQFIELANEGPTLLLALCEQKTDSAYPIGATIALDIAVRDADAELGRLRQAGIDLVHNKLQASPVGPYFAVRDPSGNIIELVQFS